MYTITVKLVGKVVKVLEVKATSALEAINQVEPTFNKKPVAGCFERCETGKYTLKVSGFIGYTFEAKAL